MSLPAPNSITPLSPNSYYDNRAGEGAPNSTQSPPLSPRSYYANRAGEIKPTINLSLVDKRAIRKQPEYPFRNISNRGQREPLKYPFFLNAKATSMLERGLKMSTSVLVPGQKGILIDNDGDEEEVEVESVNTIERWREVFVYEYRFKDNSGKIFNKNAKDRHIEWDFYRKTKAKQFVPKVRNGGKKKTRKTRRKSRSSRK